MKLLIFIFLAIGSNLAVASECTLTEVGAKAMAELYVLKNEADIRAWISGKEDISIIAKRIAETASYSEERNSYFFDVVTYANNGGPWYSGAWLEASCSGIHMDYEFVD